MHLSTRSEIIRGALNAQQLQRLLTSVFSKPFPTLLFGLDGSNIARRVAGIINPYLGNTQLTYYDVVNIGNYAARIISSGHQSAALIAFDGPLQLSGGVTIQPGDIAIYNDVTQDIIALSGKQDIRVLRYYHAYDQPPRVPPEVMATIAQTLTSQDVLNLCSSAQTFDETLCRSASTLQQLWKMNIAEYTPLNDRRLAMLKEQATSDVGRERYIKALQARYLSALRYKHLDLASDDVGHYQIKDAAKHGYDKIVLNAVSKEQQLARSALDGAALGGHAALFRILVDRGARPAPLAFVRPEEQFDFIVNDAIRGGSVEILNILENIIPISYRPAQVKIAAESGILDMYKYIEAKTDLDKDRDRTWIYRNKVGDRLLSDAVKGGSVDVIKYVLPVTGIDVAFSPGELPYKLELIETAVKSGNLDVVGYLESIFTYSADDYEEVLMGAIESGNTDVVRYVLAKVPNFPDIVKRSTTKFNPILKAILHGNIEVVDLLVKASGTTLARSIKNAIPMAFRNAAGSSNVHMVKYILDNGLDPSKLTHEKKMNVLVHVMTLDMLKYLMPILKFEPANAREILDYFSSHDVGL